ncbi:MAG: hypothetical protein B0D91_05185 [Oceanospirillales bacterium LUC14_002_19_P2]|nr:MAG: hypothetical protein B0D91_05185 [Oceanospirillales bacterium LUC14_002_19_P2]
MYWPYLRCEDGKPVRGKKTILGPSDMTENELWNAYFKLKKKEIRTVRWMFSVYLESDLFDRISHPEDRRKRKNMVVDICNTENSRGKRFGDILVNDLTPPLIKKYLMSIPSESSRKKRHNLITMAWNACINDEPGMPENQSQKLKLVYKARPLGRYVSDESYWLVYNLLPPYWQAIMELSYILRSRVGELATICMDDILEEGLYYQRSKGSNPEITLWTDRLRKAVDFLITHRPRKTDSPFLVFNATKKKTRARPGGRR